MIAENAADLLARVKSIEALTNAAGLAIGGRAGDPSLLKIPPPAAWILFGGDQADEEPHTAGARGGPGMVPSVQIIMAIFRVLVYVAYVDDNDLLTNQYPLLESVIRAIRGQPAPSGHRWRYLGQKLTLVYNDRLAYEQRYTLDMVI